MINTPEKNIDLTNSQLSLWTGQRLHPNIPLHNTIYTFKIEGVIDEPVFKKAFQEVVESTEALRTIFLEKENDIPIQRVLNEMNFELEVIDLSTKLEFSEVEKFLERRSSQLLDISKCVFDTALVKVNTQKYIWFLNIHHLVTDAVSLNLIFEDTQKRYAFLKDSKTETIVKRPSFESYVEFEKEKLANPKNEAVRDYWKQKVEGLNKIKSLYGNTNSEEETEAERITIKLGKERSEKLRELAKAPEIKNWTVDLTLFNIFTTVLATFLSRVSGQKKFALGSPSHNRSSKLFRETVGCFIEIFPLSIEVLEQDTFVSLTQRIRLETNEFLKNINSASVTPEVSRSFNVVLNYINTTFPDFAGMATSTEWVANGHIDAAHNLRCHVLDFDATGEIDVIFDLNLSVFDKDVITNLPVHFLAVLDALIADKNQKIDQTPLISDHEKNQYLAGHESQIENSPSILQQFDKQVKRNPSKTALRFKKKALTFKQLNEKSNQLANFLRSKGVGKNNKIALYFDRSPEYVVSLLAVLKSGGTFIPIPSDQPPQRVSYILQDSDCTLVLTNSELKNKIGQVATEIVDFTLNSDLFVNSSDDFPNTNSEESDIAYMIYTSGSTGNPKGVLISHGAISNYLNWAKKAYEIDGQITLPLFTSIGFDLTITSTFLPLIVGGELIIYREGSQGPDISLMEVLADNKVNGIKLTPSHLALLQGMDLSHSTIKTMIVGGEDFKSNLAISVQKAFAKELNIYNEYGPTEATVGCIVSRFDEKKHKSASVPIGKPIDQMQAYVLDSYQNLVPRGVVGELNLSGAGLAEGYANLPDLTKEKFVSNPFQTSLQMYRTGDLARYNEERELEYLGRIDEQIKLKGFRIELSDIEANMLDHDQIKDASVVMIENKKAIPEDEVINCAECGLPSNYPNTDFDDKGVCHLCNAFKGYKEEAKRYFKTEDELKDILISKRGQSPNYDCLSLLSGGKDSTYILSRLIGMGLKVLAFTLDNGYISDQAKGNIDKIVEKLGVDHIYGTTEYMNAIFVDSLHRHQNVCNGCFKTIYTLSTKIALDKQIPFVVTGLSRGQFFETRLTEELFWDENVDVGTIDKTILEARKLYHQEEDAVKNLMDVSMFQKEETFDKVQFVDFYRYSDVSLGEMLKHLKENVGWVRPTDTGRSTNCLINQVGIYVHKKNLGYSNYSFPYSWDVRMGHKTRTETLEEINEYIDEKEVKRIMDEIGYQDPEVGEMNQKRLVGYYTGKEKLSTQELATYLKKELPEYMIPTHFKYLEELPLTSNGKVNKSALKALNSSQLEMETTFVAPEGEIEELLAEIWKEVLRLKQVGVHDDFIALGGHSLAAIRVTARINEEIEMKFPLNKIFELPTIIEYAKYIEETLISLMSQEE